MPMQSRKSVSPMNNSKPLVDLGFSPYRTRRKSSLSNNPFSSFKNDNGFESPELDEVETKKCFRCQKLLDQDDIKIAPRIDSSIVTPFYIEDDTLSKSPNSVVSSVFSTPFASPNSSYSTSSSPSFMNKRRRRSSAPLTASFQESLLTGRTSGVPSNPISFTAKLVISEFDPVTDRPIISNKEYARNTIQFNAIYYNWQANEDNAATESPYVGNIDLDKCFIEREISSLNEDKISSNKRSFPGHIIPESFVIQLVLINDQDNVSDCLVFKFDLASENLHNGEKTFLRKSSFVVNKDIRQFISTIQINIGKVKNRYILFNNIKVIFYNKVLPMMSNDDLSASLVVKHTEILKGGKSKLNLDFYKKCSTCNQLNEKLLHLKNAVKPDTQTQYQETRIQLKDDTPPPPSSSSISKRLVFGDFDQGQEKYRDASVFDDDDDDEDEEDVERNNEMDMRRKNSISFRNKRRESFMF